VGGLHGFQVVDAWGRRSRVRRLGRPARPAPPSRVPPAQLVVGEGRQLPHGRVVGPILKVDAAGQAVEGAGLGLGLREEGGADGKMEMDDVVEGRRRLRAAPRGRSFFFRPMRPPPLPSSSLYFEFVKRLRRQDPRVRPYRPRHKHSIARLLADDAPVVPEDGSHSDDALGARVPVATPPIRGPGHRLRAYRAVVVLRGGRHGVRVGCVREVACQKPRKKAHGPPIGALT